ncbi:hypothetical protein D0U04_29700 [Bacillus clarus]|uniref:Putative membrane protein n=1 Tax=Bacillus clarus TaxID=2338372 RepID=A0A090Z8R7_9BACI|nr:hypothetical protein [Bacillus clarus]KFN06580.1 putative membrane protein [Bacillus clarus]RFT61901.1 hypothetical protein D0U04_29700 [Bacillus clarus]
MKILRSKFICGAIGANIIFCLALLVYVVFYNELIYPNQNYVDTRRDCAYIFYAFIIPLVISTGFSIIALYKEKTQKKILVPNLFFSIEFLIFTGGWFLFISG